MGDVSDIKLNKQDASPRLQQVISEIVEILNQDGYQRKTYSSAPTSTSPGFEGEKRTVIEGVTLTEYKYNGGQWWYSDATVVTGWSKL